jgi:HCOMODA/2-hydroxy-3-carboxy-muconic semialdehyde decarboxylase
MPAATDLSATIRDLVVANRILSREGVVDGFGHISARHPHDPGRYLMSRPRAPELVVEDDILEFDLDSTPIKPITISKFSERFIHGQIYKARPDINGVCHNHAHSLIPYGVTETVMKPILHVASVIGAEVPIWEIREEFGNTNMLVTDNERGRSLARALGGGRTILMRGHGATVAAHSLKATVYVAVYLMVNAALLREAREMGKVNFLNPEEIALLDEMNFSEPPLERAWEYWARRAGY